MQRLAVGGAAVLGRDKKRPSFLVARPSGRYETGFLVPSVAEYNHLNAVVFTDV